MSSSLVIRGLAPGLWITTLLTLACPVCMLLVFAWLPCRSSSPAQFTSLPCRWLRHLVPKPSLVSMGFTATMASPQSALRWLIACWLVENLAQAWRLPYVTAQSIATITQLRCGLIAPKHIMTPSYPSPSGKVTLALSCVGPPSANQSLRHLHPQRRVHRPGLLPPPPHPRLVAAMLR